MGATLKHLRFGPARGSQVTVLMHLAMAVLLTCGWTALALGLPAQAISIVVEDDPEAPAGAPADDAETPEPEVPLEAPADDTDEPAVDEDEPAVDEEDSSTADLSIEIAAEIGAQAGGSAVNATAAKCPPTQRWWHLMHQPRWSQRQSRL